MDDGEFLKRAADPYMWLKQGRGHLAAAQVLYVAISDFELALEGTTWAELALDFEVHKGLFCLDGFWIQIGYAIECFLKGVIVRDDSSAIRGGAFTVKSHNFLRLTRRAGVRSQLADVELFYSIS